MDPALEQELAEVKAAVADTRPVVKSLQRHTRTATQLLTNLEQRLERLEQLNAHQEAQRHGHIEVPNPPALV